MHDSATMSSNHSLLSTVIIYAAFSAVLLVLLLMTGCPSTSNSLEDQARGGDFNFDGGVYAGYIDLTSGERLKSGMRLEIHREPVIREHFVDGLITLTGDPAKPCILAPHGTPEEYDLGGTVTDLPGIGGDSRRKVAIRFHIMDGGMEKQVVLVGDRTYTADKDYELLNGRVQIQGSVRGTFEMIRPH